MNTESTSAHIARNKSRVKHYGVEGSNENGQSKSLDKVYLNNGDNFEIELYNGYTTEVLAKIWLNDELISLSGLILKPGQRYFLERFIDSNNKFKFDTYEVENTESVKEAIKNNGKVRIEFYQKSITSGTWTIPATKWPQQDWTIQNPWITNPYYIGDSNITLTNSIGFTSDANVLYTSVNNSVAGSLETGRIEKGEASNQTFESVSMDFSPLASIVTEIQILPTSQQPVEVNQIRNYCSGCGTRIRKQSWKFCPNCGESLD